MNDKPRTLKQNSSLHKYCDILSRELNAAGLDMRATLKPTIEMPWSPENIKEHLFKPLMKAMTHKESTTELSTIEMSAVYETLNRHTASKLGVSVEWPSNDILSRRQ